VRFTVFMVFPRLLSCFLLLASLLRPLFPQSYFGYLHPIFILLLLIIFLVILFHGRSFALLSLPMYIHVTEDHWRHTRTQETSEVNVVLPIVMYRMKAITFLSFHLGETHIHFDLFEYLCCIGINSSFS